eukprot:4945245-Amphidinium_carterae.1
MALTDETMWYQVVHGKSQGRFKPVPTLTSLLATRPSVCAIERHSGGNHSSCAQYSDPHPDASPERLYRSC